MKVIINGTIPTGNNSEREFIDILNVITECQDAFELRSEIKALSSVRYVCTFTNTTMYVHPVNDMSPVLTVKL